MKSNKHGTMEQNAEHITTIILTYHMHNLDKHNNRYSHAKMPSNNKFQGLSEKTTSRETGRGGSGTERCSETKPFGSGDPADRNDPVRIWTVTDRVWTSGLDRIDGTRTR